MVLDGGSTSKPTTKPLRKVSISKSSSLSKSGWVKKLKAVDIASCKSVVVVYWMSRDWSSPAFPLSLFAEQRRSTAGVHRHAQEQLTRSQHFLPDCPTITKWPDKTNLLPPRSPARTWIQALTSALIFGSTATGKTLLEAQVSLGSRLSECYESLALFFFPCILAVHPFVIFFLQWLSLHLPFFPFK